MFSEEQYHMIGVAMDQIVGDSSSDASQFTSALLLSTKFQNALNTKLCPANIVRTSQCDPLITVTLFGGMALATFKGSETIDMAVGYNWEQHSNLRNFLPQPLYCPGKDGLLKVIKPVLQSFVQEINAAADQQEPLQDRDRVTRTVKEICTQYEPFTFLKALIRGGTNKKQWTTLRVTYRETVMQSYEELSQYIDRTPQLRSLFIVLKDWANTHCLLMKNDTTERELREASPYAALPGKIVQDMMHRCIHPLALYSLAVHVLVKCRMIESSGSRVSSSLLLLLDGPAVSPSNATEWLGEAFVTVLDFMAKRALLGDHINFAPPLSRSFRPASSQTAVVPACSGVFISCLTDPDVNLSPCLDEVRFNYFADVASGTLKALVAQRDAFEASSIFLDYKSLVSVHSARRCIVCNKVPEFPVPSGQSPLCCKHHKEELARQQKIDRGGDAEGMGSLLDDELNENGQCPSCGKVRNYLKMQSLLRKCNMCLV